MRHRDFALLWSGSVISNVGNWMQQIAQAWLIYDMDANGRFSAGFEGLRLDSACAPNHTVP